MSNKMKSIKNFLKDGFIADIARICEKRSDLSGVIDRVREFTDHLLIDRDEFKTNMLKYVLCLKEVGSLFSKGYHN